MSSGLTSTWRVSRSQYDPPADRRILGREANVARGAVDPARRNGPWLLLHACLPIQSNIHSNIRQAAAEPVGWAPRSLWASPRLTHCAVMGGRPLRHLALVRRVERSHCVYWGYERRFARDPSQAWEVARCPVA